MLDSVIFDVDGTLWDSTPKVANAWQLTCRRLGVPAEHITGERLQKEFGKTMEEIGYSIFPDRPPEEAVRITRQVCIEENEYLKNDPPELYPGVRHLLHVLRDADIGAFIVSNCQAGYIEVLIESCDIGPYVRGHLCPGDTGEAKAANIRRIIQEYGLSHPVYVGDTMGDYTATKEAGDIPFVYAAYGFGYVPHPDAVIHKPMDLCKLL